MTRQPLGLVLGRRSAPEEPESEDLLALEAIASGSHADPAPGSQTDTGGLP